MRESGFGDGLKVAAKVIDFAGELIESGLIFSCGSFFQFRSNRISCEISGAIVVQALALAW